MNPTTAPDPVEQLVTRMTDQLATLLRPVCQAVLAAAATLTDLEQHVLPAIHALGNAMLTGLCTLTTADPPLPTSPCACGQPARTKNRQIAQMAKAAEGTIAAGEPWAWHFTHMCRSCCAPAPFSAATTLCSRVRLPAWGTRGMLGIWPDTGQHATGFPAEDL